MADMTTPASQVYPPIPPDNLERTLTLAQPDTDQNLPHLGVVGDTYTILLTGEDTALKARKLKAEGERLCLIF